MTVDGMTVEGTTLAIFDLDNTLVRGNMSVRFGLFLLKRGVFSRCKILMTMGVYSAFSIGIISFERMQRNVFRILFEDECADSMYKEAFLFFNQISDSLIRSEVLQELREYQETGATVAILSSSPDFIVKLFASRFGADHYQASQYVVNAQGRFESVIPLRGSDKVDSLHLFPGYSRTVAYSDSIADVSLLSRVDEPVVVSPDRKLLRYALEQGWRIL